MNISGYIIEHLRSNGVERIYGIVGDSLSPITATAIRRDVGQPHRGIRPAGPAAG